MRSTVCGVDMRIKETDMTTSKTIAFSIATFAFTFSLAWAQPPDEADKPTDKPAQSEGAGQTEAPGPQEKPGQADAAKPSEAPKEPKQSDVKTPKDKKRPRREPVKVVDISPELATHEEAESLKVEFKQLSAMRLRQDGSLLACDREAKVIKVIGIDGEQVDAIQLEFAPEALDIASDGTIYCGGKGKLAKLDETGRILKMVTVPDDVAPKPKDGQPSDDAPAKPAAKETPDRTDPPPAKKPPTKEAVPAETKERASADVASMAVDKEPTENADPTPAEKQAAKNAERPPAEAKPAEGKKPPRPARRRKKSHPKQISGIAVSKGDVFVAFGSGWSTGSKSKLYRFDLELENPKQLAEGLRGCCQRCDILARDGVLYLAENSAHRVVLYDREGNVLAKWGERGRNDLKTFGACCNPMNICFDAQGILYTSESGLGRVKRYTTDGKYLDLVGYVGTNRFWHGSGLAASCSNMAIVATPDGDCVYVMDHRNKSIRVLRKKCAAADAESKKGG